MNAEFDRKLGADFLNTVPLRSGVYIFRDEQNRPLYVGKAKNLRRRLSQYRLATTKKRHRKMRLIIKQACTLDIRVCLNEQEALLLENQLIQEHRPALNVAGAFFFMYPFLGIKQDPANPLALTLAYSSCPEELEKHEFQLYGSFRSRQVVTEAYEALVALFKFVGHHTPAERKHYGEVPYSRIIAFRQIDSSWQQSLMRLFDGQDLAFVKELALHLLEKPKARQQASHVQDHLKALQNFYYEESSRLRIVKETLGLPPTLVSQADRDRVFLEWNELKLRP